MISPKHVQNFHLLPKDIEGHNFFSFTVIAKPNAAPAKAQGARSLGKLTTEFS
jgi:hypothetical protein